MERFSQNNEQDVILEYFGNFKGVFIDLGCNDGITFSNTYALTKLGWKGVYVDASPAAFNKLLRNIPLIDNFWMSNIALADHDGTIILNDSGALVGDADVGLVSTVHLHEKRRFEKSVNYRDVEINCCTWETFIDICPYSHFDFVSMDIEGSEMSVLPYMDLKQTKMICIEFNGDLTLKKQYEKHLQKFELVYTSGENLIYALP